jgi:ribonuclease P protein component
VAVVVSRKVHKSAVARNRIRRRIYAAARDNLSDINQPYDIIFMVFSDRILEEPAASLDKQVKQQLTAAGVLKNSGGR